MTLPSFTRCAARAGTILIAIALGACATAPAFTDVPIESAPSPYLVAEAPQQWLDRPVVWGGMILEVRNYERHSEIEILAYPLDAKQRPMLEKADHGRFIALFPGYVEAKNYPEGRFLSLIGRITGERRGAVRSAPYLWPEIDVDRLHLWPRDFRAGPKFSIGIGVGVKL
jgi:outer membrane lipoprotein